MRTYEEHRQEDIVAKRIAEALKKRHMTASELSDRMQISKSTMSYYLRGRFMPKQDKIIAMSKILRVSPSWLMGFDEQDHAHHVESSHGDDIYRRFFSRNDAVSKAFKEFANTLIQEEQTNLSAVERKMLDRFKSLNVQNQRAVMTMIESLLAQQKAPSVEGEGS